MCVNSSSEDIYLYGDKNKEHCDDRIHIEDKEDVQDRSYCPWYNVINHDANRYPQDIAQARCRCDYGMEIGINSRCKPVQYFMRVLRNTWQYDNEGLFIYKSCLQIVNVGCTMVKAA